MRKNKSESVYRWRINEYGWVNDTSVHIHSENFDSRPDNCDVEAIIIHAISLPLARYGTNHIQHLFTNSLDLSAHSSFIDLNGIQVSAHFLIQRSGHLVQFVSTNERAWHAGKSYCLGRERVNDFSVGIELEGCDYESFSRIQYSQLALLVRAIRWRYPKVSKANCFAHADIAPHRKTDPGPYFNWQRFKENL